MQKTIHRINDFSLLRFNSNLGNESFFKVVNPNSQIQIPNGQYILNNTKSIEQTVWANLGILNKIYSTTELYVPQVSDNLEILPTQYFSVMIRQGFRWTDTFGLLVILRGIRSGSVYIDQIITPQDFEITGQKELINGSFWLEECKLSMPKTNEILEAEILPVKFTDIETNNVGNLGYIYNYPNELIPLIDEKTIPDYINVVATVDDNMFITIRLTTTENKTLEQSILDYFEISSANLSINYVITYGQDGSYLTTRISNDDNMFGPVRVGLDLSQWTGVVYVHIVTEVSIDGKLLSRETSLNIDNNLLNPVIGANITHPDTNYPVELKIENVINNTVIEAKEVQKIVPIYQKVFAEFIKDDFKIEKKTIYFDNITFPCYLIVDAGSDKEQILINSVTIDNKYLFDLSLLVPVDKETTYQLKQVDNGTIIGNGKILI